MRIGGDGSYAEDYGCQCGHPEREHDGDCLPGSDPLAVLYRQVQRRPADPRSLMARLMPKRRSPGDGTPTPK